MIHLLEITPDLTPQQAKKLSRRYAMTGGVEYALKAGLSAQDLDKIVEAFLPDLTSFEGTLQERANSIAATILRLVAASPELSASAARRLGS